MEFVSKYDIGDELWVAYKLFGKVRTIQVRVMGILFVDGVRCPPRYQCARIDGILVDTDYLVLYKENELFPTKTLARINYDTKL